VNLKEIGSRVYQRCNIFLGSVGLLCPVRTMLCWAEKRSGSFTTRLPKQQRPPTKILFICSSIFSKIYVHLRFLQNYAVAVCEQCYCSTWYGGRVQFVLKNRNFFNGLGWRKFYMKIVAFDEIYNFLFFKHKVIDLVESYNFHINFTSMITELEDGLKSCSLLMPAIFLWCILSLCLMWVGMNLKKPPA
jgi:hypothetical protein